MPFDYNSFLQGVQTGLRLGRTSPGRVPPMPPVPGGRYILTESGIPIITEQIVFDQVDLIDFNVWYETIEPHTSSGVDYPYMLYNQVTFDGYRVPANMFGAKQGDRYGLIIVVPDTRTTRPRVYISAERKDDNGRHVSIGITDLYMSVQGPTSNGFWYVMYWFAFTVPKNLTYLDLTGISNVSGAIRDYVENLGPLPIITEGG